MDRFIFAEVSPEGSEVVYWVDIQEIIRQLKGMFKSFKTEICLMCSTGRTGMGAGPWGQRITIVLADEGGGVPLQRAISRIKFSP